VTIDTVQQKICLVTHPALIPGADATRVIYFEEIEQICLNHWEHGYTIRVADEYSSHDEPRIWQRWAIELTLKDGQIVTIGEETGTHRAGETSAPARQRDHWESLAARVSELLGKPLAAMPAVRDRPRTFVQEIDQILQDRLKQSGQKDLSLNVRAGKDLGIEIVVNGRAYAAVDQIEDQVIRDLIQASIYEWQNKSK
jgi:hypothetical protein